MVARCLMLLLPLLALALLPPAAPAAAQPVPACQQAAQAALSQQNAIYSQGGYLPNDPVDAFGQPLPRTGPDSFDCSGLVWWAYQQAGVDVGWTTHQQVNDGQRLPCTLDDLDGSSTTCWAPGDLAFAQSLDKQHVSIYISDGLFLDCYSHAVNCILHDISQDSFYQAQFWQARRIVAGCESLTIDPGQPTPGSPGGLPPLETPRFALLPDLLGYVSWHIPQCDECADDGQPVIRVPGLDEAPPLPTLSDWVAESQVGWLSVPVPNPGNGFLMIFNWLAWHIGRWFLWLVCWLLLLFNHLARMLTDFANLLVSVANFFWRLGLFIWLSLGQWAAAFWSFLALAREVFIWGQAALAWLLAWLDVLGHLLLLALTLAGQLVLLLLDMLASILGLLSWIGGLAIGLILAIIAALQGTTLPGQLADQHAVYYMLRGILDAIHDSLLAWLMYLMYGLAYVAFVFWLSRFLPSAKES